ncbi:NAD(P)/FAD-dependent oxidoreductase [Halieaceae bacterium IMCC8485]|uniref:Pyridine nucleotide-disulfide oxidoreductase domain-containing protein 2 n=1 Tax=Candidatus Seongchinamella marina TaxID=2518990 RepID=A0ABT3SWZ8_9GAMM|nr:NAD(P)/FAD-dependent oxidoreductase [Candidatus Seongchinamella marina]MCX2974529.1 NAD(P)/FAD-dependent oxidoreductase [Candidatus Seongchinamella marina]
MTDYDVLMVGAGHNGLVCAHALAKSGRKVLMLEAGDVAGGCAATREFAPGFSVSSCAQWLTQLSPRVMDSMSLVDHGLQFAARDLASVSLAEDGDHLVLRGAKLEGANISAEDQLAYEDFSARMMRFTKILAKAFSTRAPKLVESNFADRLTLIKLGLGLKLLGKNDMNDLMRIILINMYDVMEENFDHPRLKALLSLDGMLGSHMGPRSPNTVFGYLYRRVGNLFGYDGPAQLRGGMGALADAMVASCKAAGVEIRCGEAVASIDSEAGQVIGVTLASGEQFSGKLVVSNVDPVTTFQHLVGYRNLETGVVRSVSNIRNKSGTAKLHLALSGLPSFAGLSAELTGHRLVIAPDMNYAERAFNAVKYSEYSKEPVMDISIPTVNDPGLAPDGQHVISAIVQFAPHEPEGGWDGHRQAFTDIVLDLLERYAPGIRGLVTASELLTPQDLEKEFGMTGGHWHHGELSLDQVMMMRPFHGANQYSTPVNGLYLCGAGSHPGGGVMGLAGLNAANEIIKRVGAA